MWDFLGGIGDVLSGIGSDVWSVIQTLAGWVLSGFETLGAAIVAVWNYLLSALSKIGNFLAHVWQHFIKGIFVDALHLLERIFAFLHKYAALAFKYLHRVQQFLDRYYKQYIRPQLIMMQRIRQVLGIFRLLHIHTFDKLDKYLQHAEAQLIETFLQIRGYVNLVAGFVNNLATPLGILKLAMLGAAGPRQTAALIRGLTGFPMGWFFPNFHKNAPPWQRPIAGASQLQSPLYNPPVSDLLGPVQDAVVPDSFTDANPIPDNSELDVPPAYMFDDVVLGFAQADSVGAFDTGDPLGIIQIIESRDTPFALAGIAGADSIIGLARGQ